jgi:hypothetical protein
VRGHFLGVLERTPIGEISGDPRPHQGTPSVRCSDDGAYNFLILAEYRWEGQQPLSAGKHTIVFDFTYDGPGIAKGGSGVLRVDGQDVATLTIPHTIAFLMVADETFDVGVDTRTPVNDKDYRVPFRFNGTIDKLTFNLGPVQLAAEDQRKVREAVAKARD